MIEAGADLCEAFIPRVFGGRLDQWTVIAPGAWRGTEWPCPGAAQAAHAPRVRIVCTCGCHAGAFTHALPEHCAPRTGVHPTELPP